MNIVNDRVTCFHYTLRNDAGEVVDSSSGKEPLAYLHGHNNIVPGLEKELEGHQAGDSLQVTVEPEEAYGQRQEALVQEAPRNAFKEIDGLAPGMHLQVEGPSGPTIITVTEVGEETVTIDANHALAGETLHFEVEITDVREAEAEELDHGHPHGPDGH